MVYTKPIRYMILWSMMGRHRHENRRPITGTSMALRSRQVIVSVNACLLLLLLIITPIDVGMFGKDRGGRVELSLSIPCLLLVSTLSGNTLVTLSETMLALRSTTDAPEITGRSCAGRKEEAFFSVLYFYMLIGKETNIPHRISSNQKISMWVLTTQRLVINIWHLISQQTHNNILIIGNKWSELYLDNNHKRERPIILKYYLQS